jgi:hypothetical protein
MNMQISFVLSFANGSTRGAFLPSCAIQGFPSWFAVLDCKSRIVCGTEAGIAPLLLKEGLLMNGQTTMEGRLEG